VFHAVIQGPSGAVSSLGGCLLGAGLFFPLFALGGMGAGDVKLVGALGAWLGPGQAVWVVLSSAIAGGVLGLVYALAIGYARTAITNVLALLAYWRTVGLRPAPELTLANQRVPRFPYALPIAVGTIFTVWFR
jgi:prepilin peptidase CpaA